MDEQAARGLGVSRSTIYRWRTGATQPSPRMREALASAVPGWSQFESSTWVRAARREFGSGQTGFAIACGVTQSVVSKWETGSLPLAHEVATDLHHALSLPASLDPASPEPCETDEECARRYTDHTSALIIQSGPDADWRAAQLCSAMDRQATQSVEVGRMLAALFANRSLWHLVNQSQVGAEAHARTAIRIGGRYGFNVESGYALWSLARTRFLPGFGSMQDVALLDREIALAESRLEGVPQTYASLLRGARAMAIGDNATCASELASARDKAPSEAQTGVVGRWGETYWQRDITIYHAMLALSAGRFAEACRVIEPLADEPFDSTVARQYGQSVARHYFQVASFRLGCRPRIETAGPLLTPRLLETIRRNTARLCACRFHRA